MAIFGLFGKKDSKPAPVSEQKASPAGKRVAGDQTRPAGAAPVMPVPSRSPPQSQVPSSSPAVPPQDQRVQRVPRDPALASATAKKIDAIESEMSSEFTPTRPLPPHMQMAPRMASAPPMPASKREAARNTVPHAFESTLPSIGMSTEFLLGPQGKSSDIEIVGSDAAQVIEEAAILYASDQVTMAEQVLLGAIENDTLGEKSRQGWLMLFDLHQLTGAQTSFENLSIDYASKFETSPPSWIDAADDSASATRSATTTGAPAPGKNAPTVAFVGKLDGGIVKLLERVQKLGESSPVLRLEFARVTEVDAIGCGLLLRILKKLHASGHDLVLVGAPELTDQIRAILKVGRRDETEAPWLLLLEIQRLLNLENAFEETSIDYCVTFEVSPPAFVAPSNKVTTADAGVDNPAANSFSMPALIEGRTDEVIATVAAFAASHDPAVIDCTRLRRIDFNSCGQLLSSLAPLTAAGKAIEFRAVNHMVAALFDVMGLKDVAHITRRKF